MTSGHDSESTVALDRATVEAAVRRYLGRLAARNLPWIAVCALLVAALVLVPERDGQKGAGATALAGPGSAATSGARDSPVQSSAGPGASAVAGQGPAGAITGGAVGSTVGSSGPGLSSLGPVSTTGSGLSRTGLRCGGDVRQMTWTRYAPLCTPAFTGNNGGATSFGVTKDTITLTFRISNSGEASAINAATGAAGGYTYDQFVSEMNTYISYFNKQFELYGRHVVLKAFTGKGDWVSELQGQNLQGAQEDAATAHDLRPFADVSLDANTEPYLTALAQYGVIGEGAPFFSQQFFRKYAPYEYSYVPSGSKVATWMGNTICQRMKSLPAVFSGDATLQQSTRKFGLMVPDSPTYSVQGDTLEAVLRTCGVSLAKRVNYALDLRTQQQEATNAVAQMKAAGVTTIVLLTDPITPIFMTGAADGQVYHPEWMGTFWGDYYGRQNSQTQWNHALASDGLQKAATDTEAYRAFKLASPGSEPLEHYFTLPYRQLLMVFRGLQAAGPNLTPATFQRGMASLPPSLPGGDFGPWTSGGLDQAANPPSAFQLGWWNANATGADGKQGRYDNCLPAGYTPFDRRSAFGPAGTQLHCFGR